MSHRLFICCCKGFFRDENRCAFSLWPCPTPEKHKQFFVPFVPSDRPPDVVDSSLSSFAKAAVSRANRRCSLCSANSYRFFAKTVHGASRAVFALGNRDHVGFKKEGSWVHSGLLM